ncbi:hypothetical protein GPJ59_09695 [Streptomyces bambusae]|uniref:Uncharacterized protein n=1 Tax=Streptomyces bambusae TaxID=1550616 RepID=A0ABS6Z349_9ACTN|nr:hypothetical protein [Streptomyces bambusae]
MIGPAPADLHDVDWANSLVPGDFCDLPEPVRLTDGVATATSRTWGTVRVRSGRNVTYGDTDGDQRDEAALHVGCDDNGATMSGQLAVGYVVLSRLGDSLAVLGTITPRQKQTGSYGIGLTQVDFAPGRITVHERWHRPTDPRCCPTGESTTVWTREGNRLVPGEPRVVS